ncbi:MAG: class II aldolase/adducin family protein [Alphaproteobacteria bacterium]
MSLPLTKISINKYQTERQDLACLFRVAARENWVEAVANHFSYRVNDNEMLINPRKLFCLMTASDLALVNYHQPINFPSTIDKTAIGLHAPIYQSTPHANAIIHLHPPYSVVLSSLEDSTLYPIDQCAALLHGKVVIDKEYGGLALDEEGKRCSQSLQDPNKKILLLGNHGVLAIGKTLADAWNNLYYFERAAKHLILSYQTQKPLQMLSHQIAQRTAMENDNASEFCDLYFESLKELINREEPDYKN